MKITENIENYSGMTTEEKLAALEALEMPRPDYTGWVKKEVLDKAASEAATYKKQLREKMSEDEARAAAAAEEQAALVKRAEEAERALAISNYAASYLALGYSAELAKSTAEALAGGDMETVFKNQQVFVDAREQALKTEWMKGTPRPAGGNPEAGMKKEDFSKMSLAEKQKFATENPEAYKEFYK